jgi:hypothetical protein
MSSYPADNSKQQQLSGNSDGHKNGAKMIAGVHIVTLMASATMFAPSARSPFDARFRLVIAPLSMISKHDRIPRSHILAYSVTHFPAVNGAPAPSPAGFSSHGLMLHLAWPAASHTALAPVCLVTHQVNEVTSTKKQAEICVPVENSVGLALLTRISQRRCKASRRKAGEGRGGLYDQVVRQSPRPTPVPEAPAPR